MAKLSQLGVVSIETLNRGHQSKDDMWGGMSWKSACILNWESSCLGSSKCYNPARILCHCEDHAGKMTMTIDLMWCSGKSHRPKNGLCPCLNSYWFIWWYSISPYANTLYPTELASGNVKFKYWSFLCARQWYTSEDAARRLHFRGVGNRKQIYE